VEVLGLAFVGSVTHARAAHAAFLREVLGLAPLQPEAEGVDADVFRLPDGSGVAVTSAGDGSEERTVGFLVADLDAACAELVAAGVETGQVAVAGPWRYVHFRAPDGRLYELVEELTARVS
jgi:catechol 2,3-dioxygenase-like lactoylglutathione lyase family enzyme